MAKEATKPTVVAELASFTRGEITYADLSDEASGALAGAEKTEKQKKDLEQVKRAKRAGAIASVPVNILKSVAAIAQTVTGIKALKGLRPPTPPVPPERDVQLLERLRRARLEAEQPVTPAMQRAREAAAVEAAGRGRATARAATAGQLGLYAPLAQATNLGILKQMRAGVQEDEALRMQRQQIFDRLLQQRAGETARIQQSRERGFYGFEYPEFQAQRAGAVGLAQTGISSMLDILGGIPQMAEQFAAGRKPAVSPTGQPTPPASIYDVGYTGAEAAPPIGEGFMPLEEFRQGYNPNIPYAPYSPVQYTEPYTPQTRDYRSEYLRQGYLTKLPQ